LRFKNGSSHPLSSLFLKFLSFIIGFEVREGISTAISSKILSWKRGFLVVLRVGLSSSPEVPVPLDSELHSIEESAPILNMHDFALKMPARGAASSKSNSNSSILGGSAKSSRATLELILEAFLTGAGLYILEPMLRHSE